MTTPSALHSKLTPKWGTPIDYIELSRHALGGVIHLDPASSEAFNAFVRAEKIFTEQTDGLRSSWLELFMELIPYDGINVFLNPPGGLVKQFWEKLIQEIGSGVVRSAIWIGFSVEQLCTLQDSELYPLDFSTVILRKRMSFTREDGEPGMSPSHGNYITGLNIPVDIFSSCFGTLGRIANGQAALY